METSLAKKEVKIEEQQASIIIRRNRVSTELLPQGDLFDRARNIYSRGRRRFAIKASRII